MEKRMKNIIHNTIILYYKYEFARVWTTFDGLGETGDGGVCNVQKNCSGGGTRRVKAAVDAAAESCSTWHWTVHGRRHSGCVYRQCKRDRAATRRRRRRGQPNDWTWPRFAARHYAVYGCCAPHYSRDIIEVLHRPKSPALPSRRCCTRIPEGFDTPTFVDETNIIL